MQRKIKSQNSPIECVMSQPTKQQISSVTLVVENYDDAIESKEACFTNKSQKIDCVSWPGCLLRAFTVKPPIVFQPVL
jgi:hypothetical protein